MALRNLQKIRNGKLDYCYTSFFCLIYELLYCISVFGNPDDNFEFHEPNKKTAGLIDRKKFSSFAAIVDPKKES